MGLDNSKLKSFEPQRFVGDWYEISSHNPDKHDCLKYTFTYIPEKKILHLDAVCVNHQEKINRQNAAAISGLAISDEDIYVKETANLTSNIRLGPIPGEYLAKFNKGNMDKFFTIVWTDYDKWALVKVNGKKYLLSRYAQVSSLDITELHTTGGKVGFDLKGLKVDTAKPATII